MGLFGLFSLGIMAMIADLAGNDETRPFTRFAFVCGTLIAAGLRLDSLVHYTAQVLSGLI
jgi:hypothetical protein